MRALVRLTSEVRYDTSWPDPTPESGEVLVRPHRVLITAHDLVAAEGSHGFEGVLGSAFVGTIDDQSEGLHGRLTTQQRIVGSMTTSCDACERCRSGLRSHCLNRAIIGLAGRAGCLAERFTMPSQNLLAVPDLLDDERAVFAEPLAAALQTARQLTIEGRPYITVLGESLSGLLTVQVLARLNASVRLVGWQPEKLAPCDKWQIKHRPIAEVGRRADQDIVVECTGTAEGISEALRMVRPRGTVVLRSIEQLAALQEIDLTSIVLNELRIIGSWTGPLSEALAMLEREEVDVLPLISRRMRLEDGVNILRAAADPSITAVLVEV